MKIKAFYNLNKMIVQIQDNDGVGRYWDIFKEYWDRDINNLGETFSQNCKRQKIGFSDNKNYLILFARWAETGITMNNLIYFADIVLEDNSFCRGKNRNAWKKICNLNDKGSFASMSIIFKKNNKNQIVQFHKMFLFGDESTGVINNL